MPTDLEVRRQPLAPLDAQATKQAIATYQAGLNAVLDESDVQSFTDRRGGRHKFVKRSGWRKIALWCDLSLENRGVEVDRDSAGKPLRARVVARASAPNGRYADGEGACDMGERPNMSEHDMLATAATRAFNRAISNLVGLGAVSAEEVDGTVPDPDQAPPYGPEASPELLAEAQAAITKMWPHVPGGDATDLLAANFGYMPEIACRTVNGLAWLMDRGEPAATEPEATEVAPPPRPSGSVPPGPALDPDDVDIDAILGGE
jgi:hypothetical protein